MMETRRYGESARFVRLMACVAIATLALFGCGPQGSTAGDEQAQVTGEVADSGAVRSTGVAAEAGDATDAGQATGTDDDGAPRATDGVTENGTVVILATGGTIAGVGEGGRQMGYRPGEIAVEDLVASVEGLDDVAPLAYVQVANVASDDVTDEVWLELARTINEMATDPNVAGFVVTHGTDTLEETAYFLNLTVHTDKPVVVTGAMRPSTAISADGPVNLFESVVVAASEQAAGLGVLAVFSDRIIPARDVTKVSTYAVDAISSRDIGAIGIVRDDHVEIFHTPTKTHTSASEFDVDALDGLPKVSVIYFQVDADPDLLTYAAEHAQGVVVASAGEGGYSKGLVDAINDLDVPVVVSSRVGSGSVEQSNLLSDGAVAANNLSPQKAAILLRLALAEGKTSQEELIDLFARY